MNILRLHTNTLYICHATTKCIVFNELLIAVNDSIDFYLMYNPNHNPNLPIFSIAFLFVTRENIADIDQTSQHESSDQRLSF